MLILATVMAQLISKYKSNNRINRMMLVLSLLGAQGNLAIGATPALNKTSNLVDKIRRQLMKDNYDYLPSEEELFPPPTHHYDQDTPNDPLYNDNDTIAESSDRHERADLFVPRAEESIEDPKKNDHAISKKDLFYYMDDNRLRRSMNDNVDETNNDFDDTNETSTKVKYKVIKIKSVNPNRRSLSYRRFIQEENQDGVSIIRLDGQPFPEFHLPRSRRQYMHDMSGDLGEVAGDNATREDDLVR